MNSTRRPDASMDLLATIQRTAVDPEYRRVADGEGAPARPVLRAAGLMLAAGLIAMAAAQTHSSLPGVERERNDLIHRVRAAETRQDALRRGVATQEAELRGLQQAALPKAQQDPAEAVLAGTLPVTGPGITIRVDDADQTSGGPDAAQVTDQDLRRLVNGLWLAGAEAVSINGHRVSSRTAIRSAGSAITVDYRSLQHPYRVEAIGDPRSLGAELAATSAGQWWAFLKDNYRLQYEVTTSERLALPADPGLGVRAARVER
ncbi:MULTISPECIES: DUF881 domain-containing protein [unclassified Luteococcus]|uniref:DUF881 domain-containing protein n=1 Tax=unclassified Luteococcus TaxID=2639923 RepID=UPI00313C7806